MYFKYFIFRTHLEKPQEFVEIMTEKVKIF